MKKPVFAAALTLFLAACTASALQEKPSAKDDSFAYSIVKALVDKQCRSELNARTEWQLISLAMSTATQRAWEDKICGCASEEAPNQLASIDFTQLLTSEGRSRVAGEVTVKTVTACVQRLYR